MAYNIDFRKQVFKIKEEEKLTYQETSERFKVPIRTLFRWSNRIAPKTKRDRAYKVDLELLRQHIKDYPDLYQYERAAHFGVSQPTIWKLLRVLNISYKKNTNSSES